MEILMRGLYWFRNDLRLHDNPAFCSLTQQCEQLLCVYVVDERWFTWTTLQSKPLGAVRWRFIQESLADLQQNLALKGHTLLIRCGQPERIIAQLVDEFSIDAIGVTRLPATYEQRHLKNLQKSFETKRWFVEESFTLFKQEQLPFALAELPDSFTQFRHHVEAIPVLLSLTAPDSLPQPVFADLPIENLDGRLAALTSELELPFRGGESAGLQQLRYYLQETSLVSHYKDTRNGLDGWDFSSKLSPWLAQGCVSPRRILSELRAYQRQFGANESTYWLYFELLWREYFQWLLYKYGSRLFHLRGIRNVNPLLTFYAEAFMAWKQGNTDSDFVNAFMRQLKHTGWISNRGRQIVASYLVNELGVDWRFGAAWFEEQLIDYDPASNWGNWQYLAGVGTDPRGKRVFNITKQQKSYDSENSFIQKYTGNAPV
jgi:deoxyribodipyrimidine photo-lyase